MRQVFFCSLHQQDGPQHIDVVLPVKILRCDVLQGLVRGYGGVVDDDVDLELAAAGVGEVVFGRADEVGGAVRVAHVGLDAEGVDAVGGFEFFA